MSDKSLAAHVRELIERLSRITGRPWIARITVRFDGSMRCDFWRMIDQRPPITTDAQSSESLAITAASAAVARWLGENGYGPEAK